MHKSLQIVLPLRLSVVDLADMYGFGALPTARIVEIVLVHQILWQPLPEQSYFIKTIITKQIKKISNLHKILQCKYQCSN